MAKGVALIAMVLDHANKLLLIDSVELWLVGRVAYPLFVIMFALNLGEDHTRWPSMAKKLWIAALMTQPIFYLAFVQRVTDIHWYDLNILFSFAIALQLLIWHRQQRYKPVFALICFSIIPLQAESYGLVGVALILCSYQLIHGTATRYLKIGLNITWFILLATLNHFSVFPLSLPLFLITLIIIAGMSYADEDYFNDRLLPRNFFYTAYIGHLFALFVVVYLDRMMGYQ